MRDIMVAFLREWYVGLQTPRSILQHMLAPVAYLLLFAPAMAATLPSIQWKGQVVPYIMFVIPGLMALTTVSLGNSVGISVYIDKLTGELEMLFSLPIRRTALLIGLAVNAGVRALVIGAVVFLLAALVTKDFVISGVGGLLSGLGVLVISAVGWALFSAMLSCLIRDQDAYNLAINVLTLPLTFASSVFYDADQLPSAIRWVAQVNPLSYAADLLRQVLLGQQPVLTDVAGLLMFTLLAAFLAYRAVSRGRVLE